MQRGCAYVMAQPRVLSVHPVKELEYEYLLEQFPYVIPHRFVSHIRRSCLDSFDLS